MYNVSAIVHKIQIVHCTNIDCAMHNLYFIMNKSDCVSFECEGGGGGRRSNMYSCLLTIIVNNHNKLMFASFVTA